MFEKKAETKKSPPCNGKYPRINFDPHLANGRNFPRPPGCSGIHGRECLVKILPERSRFSQDYLKKPQKNLTIILETANFVVQKLRTFVKFRMRIIEPFTSFLPSVRPIISIRINI